MPNDNNLHWLSGKNKNKKKKKKQQQQQPAFMPRQAKPQIPQVVPQQPKPSARLMCQTLLQLPTPQGFQAPHHQPESMVELSDDTSPNTPLVITSGGWKPLGATKTTPVKSNPAEINITPSRQQKWLKFKESLDAKIATDINQVGINKAPEEHQESIKTGENTIQETKGQQDMSQAGKDITWELNTLDDEKSAGSPGQSKPQVVQGTASEIKLFQLKPSEKLKVAMDKLQSRAKRFSSNNLPQLTNYPKGVPRSFLAQQQNVGAIQPQDGQQYAAPQPVWELNKSIPTRFHHGPGQSTSAFDNIPGQVPSDRRPSETMTRFDQIPASKYDQGPDHLLPQSRFDQGPEYAQTSRFDGPGLQVQTGIYDECVEEQQYSPSDTYDDGSKIVQDHEGSVSSDGQGQKRLSAFHRLGPLSQPKKPKLTINLLCNQDVREVLDTEEEDEDKYTPVHLRKNMLESCDETVLKFLPFWPWRRNVGVRKAVTVRNSKTAMIMEQEQMEEVYEKDNAFIQVSVKGFPRTWRKEDVLDVLLEHVKGKSFIPCFIEFKPDECKFLVIRSRSALVTIHKLGFYLRKDDVELGVTICQTDLSLKQVDFIPRLVLRKQLAAGYDGERKLSLKEFTMKPDISHFIYFPLNRLTNQTELVQLQSTVAWDFLTDLDLSHNRITSIDAFELPRTTPKLKYLDLSHNYLDKATLLLRSRDISLKSIKLEGNPLCHDYIDPGHYVKVLKMIFPSLTEIDGVAIHLKGELPQHRRNFCPPDAEQVASKFLEVFFPLLEAPYDERTRIEEMYDDKAVLTVTYRNVLRYSPLHRKFRNIFLRARVFAEGDADEVEGAAAIARLLHKWPDMRHDTNTFTVDVLLHTDNTTIVRVDGILKLTSETLAEDEHLVAFTRTIVLGTVDGTEYKIMNEMVYWDEPCRELANVAFQMNTIRTSKKLSLQLDCPPDEDLKKNLVEIFARITELDKKSSERCLEKKDWNLKNAIEYFMNFVKLDDLDSLRKELQKMD